MSRSPLHRLAMAAAIAGSAAASSCNAPRSRPAPIPPPSRPARSVVSETEVVERLVEAQNLERGRRGLPPLRLNPELEAAALKHAREMADRRKMSHKGADGSSPFDRIHREGYAFRAAAENVAYGFDDVESVMDGWMRSPGHRRNILGDYSEVGVGRATGMDGASYWAVTFGSPMAR